MKLESPWGKHFLIGRNVYIYRHDSASLVALKPMLLIITVGVHYQVYCTVKYKSRVTLKLISLQTDDKGVFATSLSEEYSLAAEAFNLNAEQLWQMSYQAIDFIFAGDDIKQQLRQKWNKSKDGVFSELTETGMKEDIASTKNWYLN